MQTSPPRILALAGVNGAGKSSLFGSMLENNNLKFFNPDSFARELMSSQPGCSLYEANVAAWNYGVEKLKDAVAQQNNWAFETTLGGTTITELLVNAASTHDISILYCGLNSPELHLDRVKSRVTSGGHHIPEEKIRERWETSRLNLIEIMPFAKTLQVFDNSVSVPVGEEIPEPVLLLDMIDGQVNYPDFKDPSTLIGIQEWAKPLIAASEEITKKTIKNQSKTI